MDEAARARIDPVKLRRLDQVNDAHKTAVGTTIDSGEFDIVLDKALELADCEGFKQRRRGATKRGMSRIGISCMLGTPAAFRSRAPS